MGHLQYPRGGDIVVGTLYFIQLNLQRGDTFLHTFKSSFIQRRQLKAIFPLEQLLHLFVDRVEEAIHEVFRSEQAVKFDEDRRTNLINFFLQEMQRFLTKVSPFAKPTWDIGSPKQCLTNLLVHEVAF